VQGRDESWQEFNERQVRYQARVTANEKSIAEHTAAIQKQNAEIARIQHNAQFDILSTWQDRQAKAAAKYPDYVAVTTADNLPFTETMANHTIMLSNGADVAYHLGKHPTEALRISNLSVPAQIDAIARLSERLKAPSTKATKSTPSQKAATTSPTPQRSAAPARSSVADLTAMSMNDYAERRNAQLLAERRR
jgi:hypothetical protein